MRIPLGLCLALILTVSASAQFSTLYIPDNSSVVGTCNVIPFGQSVTFSAGYTYVGQIPASYLDPANPQIVDIGFAACAPGGTWACNDVLIGIGHLPNPQPCPFTFPNASSAGSFNDFTIIYDSAVSGPFNWVCGSDVWSPMGFAAGGGTGFTWNGVDDIGFFMTYLNSTVSWGGGFHRTATDPARTYSAGYLATTSTTCLALSGLKMELTVGPGSTGGAEYQVNQTTASADINGVLGTSSTPATVALGTGVTGFLSLSSTAAGNPWDIVYGLADLVPASGGGLTLADLQIINMDFTDPSLSTLFTPIFGGTPFVNVVLGVNIPAPISVSLQMAILDGASATGLWLSQGTRLVVM